MPQTDGWMATLGAGRSWGSRKVTRAGESGLAEPERPVDWAQASLLDQGLIWDGSGPEPPEYDPFVYFGRSQHFEVLLRGALADGGLVLPSSPRIAIVGSGAGDSAVSPCLRMFPHARVLAVDDRPDQLGLMRAHLREHGIEHRVLAVRAPADVDFVEPGALDLIVGVGVLHRLIDPDRGLAMTARALRPGGHAVFMEPFEGHGLLRLAFSRLRAEAELRGEPLPPEILHAVEIWIHDISAATAPDPTRPGFAEQHRKWVFASESIAAAANSMGFASVQFFTHNDHPSFYRDIAEVKLRDTSGLERIELPDWAWAIFREFDEALTPAVKRLLPIEGSIVLTR